MKTELAVASVLLGLSLASCRGPAATKGEAEPDEKAGAAAADQGGRGGATEGPVRVTLAPEAQKQAGLLTEKMEHKPLAMTLSLQARLSPVPETPEELEARLAYQAAQARDVRAEQELERARKLVADKVLAAKTLQTAEAEAAQARLDRMRAETALRNLGLDAAREPKAPAADVWALADLYGPQATQVKPGAAAWIGVESIPSETFPGRVISLARFLKPQTRTLTVRIAVRDPAHRLRPQDVATAEVQVAERTALSVPDSALLYEGVERIVFVARDGGFEKRRVQVGAQQAGRAEILSGLEDGDEVVTRGSQFLLGEIYKIRNPGAAEED